MDVWMTMYPTTTFFSLYIEARDGSWSFDEISTSAKWGEEYFLTGKLGEGFGCWEVNDNDNNKQSDTQSTSTILVIIITAMTFWVLMRSF